MNAQAIEFDSAVSNILAIWDRSTKADRQEGAAWYGAAHTFAVGLSETFGISVKQACGIVAALSPRVSWSENLRLAETVCATGSAKGLRVNVGKAERILQGESPNHVLAAPIGKPRSGRKVRSFFSNIWLLEGSAAVTIDRHAWDIAAGAVGDDASRKGLDRVGVYSLLESAYREAGERLNVHPSTVQATTWVAWRRLKKTDQL